MITMVPLTPDNVHDWDRIAGSSPDAWMFHQAGWLAMTEKSWGLDGHSFLLQVNGVATGIFPLQRRRGSAVLRSSFFGTGGPALSPGERKKFLGEMFAHAADLGRALPVAALEVHLPPLCRQTLDSRWQVNPLVEFGYEDTSTHTWVTDLAPAWEEITARFSDSVAAELKKASAAGYTIHPVTDPADMELYYRVHRETCAASGIAPHPRAYFDGVYEVMVRFGHAVIWKAVAPSGEAVAFEMTARSGDAALYWAGCCRRAVLNTGVNYLLQTAAMRWAREAGCRWFENGEAFPQAASGKLKGLTLFKRKFGGDLHRYHKGILSLGVPYSRWEGWLRKISSVVSIGGRGAAA